MALDFNMTRLLLNEWSISKTNFGKTAAIGRQGLHISPTRLQYNLNEYGLSNINSREVLKSGNGYFEPLIKLMGATTVDSIDVSHYEGANVILDLNNTIPEELKCSYDTLIESGSFEHIFNFPTAIKNCMSLLKHNGRFIIITPVNNFPGHGFYQFSPELFFRIFSKENGYELQRMILFEDTYVAKWYSVKDPNIVKQRVEFINETPTYLFLVAIRKEIKDVLFKNPYQSDYENISWNDKIRAPYEIITEIESRNKILRILPYTIKKVLNKILRFLLLIKNTISGPFDKRFFQRIK